MPRAKFNDNNITLAVNWEYPNMQVELLDKSGKRLGYFGPHDRLEHFSGEVEAITVQRNLLGHDARTQTLEMAENVDFDAGGTDVTLKMDGRPPPPSFSKEWLIINLTFLENEFYFTQEKRARFYYEYY